MWKKIVGYSLLAVLVVAGAGFGYLYFRSPASAPPSSVKVDASAARVERGKYIYMVSDCDGCHSQANEKLYDNPPVVGMKAAGQLFPEPGLPGRIVVTNITPDKETGIGNWTDGEKIRAIREGLSRDGHVLFPMMPYGNFRYMSDDDVQSLVAYLNSLPPVRNSLPTTHVDFPVSMFIKGAPRPVLEAVKTPDRANKHLYGEYLVTVGLCEVCHTPATRGSLDLTKRFAGGRRFGNAAHLVVSANITPDKQTGIGDWSLDRFQQRFYRHKEHMGKPRSDADPEKFSVMPWENLAQLPPDDLEAIYIYLRSKPAVENKVESHPEITAGKT